MEAEWLNWNPDPSTLCDRLGEERSNQKNSEEFNCDSSEPVNSAGVTVELFQSKHLCLLEWPR